MGLPESKEDNKSIQETQNQQPIILPIIVIPNIRKSKPINIVRADTDMEDIYVSV